MKKMIEVSKVKKYFEIYKSRSFSIKELFIYKKDRFDIKVVLDDINLTINSGETVALIGTNGSGKSTLLKLITRIIYPNSGRITTHGKVTSLIELGAGFHPDFTGRENIFFNASIFGLNRAEINRRLKTIIDFSELEENIDAPVRTYSSGMYMRLAFSIAVNVDADILLIDEILAVGDSHFQSKCLNKIAELISEKKTIVMVTHDLSSVLRICSRAIWLDDGKIVLDGNPNHVVDEYLKKCG